eukprot:TRINITY_DN26369_c0_g1_i2.p1 TRINITY_DN26369_c0_g1~~TRINITY_DN26369_c0_g1_i2.p1  ORF type:complete len:754 (+),score=221.17 TRINITY_DN26369_c0_g1_i2:96-2357(+)
MQHLDALEDAKDETPEPLSAKPRKFAAMMAGKDHPHREMLFKAVVPSETLEAWLEVGLHRVRKDGATWLEGFAMLPEGYKGCNKDSILITCNTNSCKTYPIAVKPTDETDGQKNRVYYHYTHRKAFESMVRIMSGDHTRVPSKEPTSGKKGLDDLHHHEVVKEDPTLPLCDRVLKQLEEDYRERVPVPTATNRKGEPELFIWEPSQFKSQKMIQQAIHDSPVPPKGFTVKGAKLQEFGDFCIAVSVPHLIVSSTAAAMNYGGCVRIDKEQLHRLQTQGHIRRENIAKKEQAERERKEEQMKAAKKGCWGFLCGWGSSADVPEFWDDVPAVQADDDNDGDGGPRVQRSKRDMKRSKQDEMDTWTKEHLINAKEKKNNDHDGILALEDDHEHEKGKKKGWFGGGRHKKKHHHHKPKKKTVATGITNFATKLAGNFTAKDPELDKIWKEHKEKEQTKVTAQGALQKLKEAKGADTSKYVRPPRGTRVMTAAEREEMEMLARMQAEAEDDDDDGSADDLRDAADADKDATDGEGGETEGDEEGGEGTGKKKRRKRLSVRSTLSTDSKSMAIGKTKSTDSKSSKAMGKTRSGGKKKKKKRKDAKKEGGESGKEQTEDEGGESAAESKSRGSASETERTSDEDGGDASEKEKPETEAETTKAEAEGEKAKKKLEEKPEEAKKKPEAQAQDKQKADTKEEEPKGEAEGKLEAEAAKEKPDAAAKEEKTDAEDEKDKTKTETKKEEQQVQPKPKRRTSIRA